uniref:Uncharacterized protein n=1 Tax=Rhizophora mucronata TaxID=61149 RepID=A0A2P2PXA5_RHIMU
MFGLFSSVTQMQERDVQCQKVHPVPTFIFYLFRRRKNWNNINIKM